MARLTLALSAGVAVLSGPAAAQLPHYHIVKRIVVDSGGADYLSIDTLRRRLYGLTYKVIDIDRDSVVGELPPHTGYGFALAVDLGKGLGRRGVLFDLNSLAPITRLSIRGDGSVYDALTHRAFLLSDTTTVVDMELGRVLGTTVLGTGGTEWSIESGVSDNAGHIFINANVFPDTSGNSNPEIVVLNSVTLAVERHWPLQACKTPLGIAMDRLTRRLFVGCSKAIAVVDANDGANITSVPVPGHADQLAFDPQFRVILAPNGHGTMSVVRETNPNTYAVIDSVPTAEGGNALVLDERTHRVYLYKKDPKAMRLVVLAP